MNLVKESLNFERGQDPKESMAVGILKDTPISELSSFLKEQYINPDKASYHHIFSELHWASIMMIKQLLELALIEEFPNIKFVSDNVNSKIIGSTQDGMQIFLNPTNDKYSFYVLFEGDLKDGRRISDNSQPQGDFEGIKKVIIKKATKWGIKI